MTRLILLYGVWIAAAMILLGIAVMAFAGRGQKWFLPRTVLGWFGTLGGFILFGIGAFSLAVFVFVDVGGKGDALRTMEGARGSRAPQLVFEYMDGRAGSLEDLTGKVVLVNFWATWCPPCIDEMPELDRIQQDFADRGLIVLHLSDEERSKVETWLTTHPSSTMHGLVEPGVEIEAPFDAMLQARPVSFAIDREGIVRDTAMGRMTRERFEAMILPHL